MSATRTGAMLLLAGVVAALGLPPIPATAAPGEFGGSGDDDSRAVDLLRRTAHAMRSTSYTGTRMVSAWGNREATTLMVDVEHVAGQGTRLTVRGGGVDETTATFLAAGGSAGPAELSVGSIALITSSYAVTTGPRDSVAGRPSTVVEVGRRGTPAARLWVDDKSGLLLRREVFDSAGRLARESAFIDVDLDASEFMAHLPPAEPEPAARGLGVRGRSVVQAAGWDCPNRSGPLQLVGIERLDNADAMHITYSDGLSRLSVFEQRGSLDPRSVRGFEQARMGAHVVHIREGMPTYAVWQDDGIVFTAVTDGPLDTVTAAVVDGGQHAQRAPGFWDRVASGMTRLGAWSTPLL